MNDNKPMVYLPTALRVIVAAAMLVIVIAGIKSAASIINLFLLSAFIAIISASPVFWLQRRGLPMALGMLLVISAVVLIVMTTALVFGSAVSGFTAELPAYQEKLEQLFTGPLNWLHKQGIEISAPSLFPDLDPRNILGMVAKLLGNVGGILGNSVLILLTVIFMLLEAPGFQTKLHLISPDPGDSQLRLAEITDNVRRYLALKTWISLGTGLCIGLWLWLLGVDYAVLWGMLAFFFNYVPNVGSIIAAVPAVLLAMIQLGFFQSMLAALGYLAANMVFGNALEPRLMGRGIGLSTLVVFVSMIFWGWVLGPVGMILSVPLTMITKIVLDSSDDTRWIAVLLGSEAAARDLELQAQQAAAAQTSAVESSPQAGATRGD